MRRRLRALISDRKAATAVEYGLVVSLIVLAWLSAFSGLADVTVNMWDDVAIKVQTSSSP